MGLPIGLKMLHWYEQEQPTSCVAACLRIVLSGYDVFCDEAEVRQWLGQPRLGITLSAAQTRLAKNGVHAEWHDDWNLDDLRDALRQGWHPIIGVERQLFGTPAARHAVVLVSLTSQTAQSLDPYDGPSPQVAQAFLLPNHPQRKENHFPLRRFVVSGCGRYFTLTVTISQRSHLRLTPHSLRRAPSGCVASAG